MTYPQGKILKETSMPDQKGLNLLLGNSGPNAREDHVVAMENTNDVMANVESSTFIGRGGPGEFKSTSTLTAEEIPYAWTITRITHASKDVACRANANMVFGNTTPPTMTTFDQIEAQVGRQLLLYGHSVTRGSRAVKITPNPEAVSWVPLELSSPDNFSADTLGHWMLSRESKTSLGCECGGLTRCAFRVEVAQADMLEPGAESHFNALHLFTKKGFKLKPKGIIIL